MLDEEVIRLLQRTDKKLSPAANDTAMLMAGMQRKQKSRAQRKVALAGVVCAAAALWLLPAPPSLTDKPVVVFVEQTSIEELQQQARLAESIAHGILAARELERLAVLKREADAAPSLAEMIAQYQAKQGAIDLHWADRLRDSDEQLDKAIAAYRAVIAHFPETRYAQIAEARLEELIGSSM
jgi:hypothetical protein